MTANTSQGRTKTGSDPSNLIEERSKPSIEKIGEALVVLAKKIDAAGNVASATTLRAESSTELQRLDKEMRIRSSLVELKETRNELLHVERALAELALQEGFTLRQVGIPLGVSLSTLSKWKLNGRYFVAE